MFCVGVYDESPLPIIEDWYRSYCIGNAPAFDRIFGSFQSRFQRDHRRQGHRFQNRYKSILCQEDPYLLELVRYIHLNPLRDGIEEALKELLTGGKQRRVVQDRSVLCYWGTRELGLIAVEISKKLNIASSTASESAMRGQQIFE